LPARAHRTRLDPEVRRELILDAAERVLVDRIPTEVTFEEIADAAEVSRGLVYNYFRDRTALLVALAERALERLDRELASAVDPGSDLPMQIAALGRAYGRHARANGGTWRLLSRAGLLDHPSVQSARAGRVARIAAEWGDTAEARLAAWSITALFELTGVDDLPDDTEGEDLTRFLRDVVSPALAARGVGPSHLSA
jgi:AcrR family transcriptional regulator